MVEWLRIAAPRSKINQATAAGGWDFRGAREGTVNLSRFLPGQVLRRDGKRQNTGISRHAAHVSFREFHSS